LDHGPPVYVAAAAYLGLIKDTKSSKGTKGDPPPGDLDGIEKFFGQGGMLQ